jgi:hypothetical protein
MYGQFLEMCPTSRHCQHSRLSRGVAPSCLPRVCFRGPSRGWGLHSGFTLGILGGVLALRGGACAIGLRRGITCQPSLGSWVTGRESFSSWRMAKRLSSRYVALPLTASLSLSGICCSTSSFTKSFIMLTQTRVNSSSCFVSHIFRLRGRVRSPMRSPNSSGVSFCPRLVLRIPRASGPTVPWLWRTSP